MAEIALTGKRGHGLFAIVDDDMVERLAGSWYLASTGYPTRGVPTGNPRGNPRGRLAVPESAYRSRSITMHRAVLGLDHGDPREGDHRNLNKLDNRRANLRIVTRAENRQNVRGVAATSRYRGVCWDVRTERWMAYVKFEGKSYWGGRHAEEIEAARAAQALRIKLMPFTIEEMI